MIDYTLPSRLFQQLQLQFQFFTSHLLLYDFVFVLLSCSVAQLLNCSTVCSASQRPRQLIMDMAKISPEAQTQAAFIQLQTTGHSLKMGAPSTEHQELGTGTQPSPAQHRPAQSRPDQARRLFNRSLHGQTKSQAQRCH